MPPNRVAVFIDEKNVYKAARSAFFSPNDQFTRGNFDPVKLAHLICPRLPPGIFEARSLRQVRVYTGRPDRTKEPKGHAAHMNQCQAWENAGAFVVARPLRYPWGWKPFEKAEQKGVDVALAVDFVVLATRGEYDVGVVVSTDTDLRPALEFVLHDFPQIRVEVASWWSDMYTTRLYVPGIHIWCHRLNRQDYNAVADLTDYRPPPTHTSQPPQSDSS